MSCAEFNLLSSRDSRSVSIAYPTPLFNELCVQKQRLSCTSSIAGDCGVQCSPKYRFLEPLNALADIVALKRCTKLYMYNMFNFACKPEKLLGRYSFRKERRPTTHPSCRRRRSPTNVGRLMLERGLEARVSYGAAPP